MSGLHLVMHVVEFPQGSVIKHLLFFVCISDLSDLVNANSLIFDIASVRANLIEVKEFPRLT